MDAYTLIAPAKINLYLEIIGDRPDGFHELAMLLQSIDLSDRIELRANGTDRFRVYCQQPEVPLDQSNLAYRAAALMAKLFPNPFNQYGGVDITIDKQIPVAAGLAGGSTDAAAVLVGLDLMWKLGLTQDELQTIGAELGSDIPFCISGGSAIATGRGNELSPLPDLENIAVVLAKYQSLGVSTAWAYQTYRQQFGASYVKDVQTLADRRERVHSGKMVGAMIHQDAVKIGQLLYNDLEKVVLPAYPQVQRLREAFAECGVLGTMMSGSGPTVFALTESLSAAEKVKQQVQNAIADPDLKLWVAQFSAHGIRIAPPLTSNS